MKHSKFLIFALCFSGSVSAYDINSYCCKVSDAVGGSYQIEKVCREQEYQ
jgi:hypothetical protein